MTSFARMTRARFWVDAARSTGLAIFVIALALGVLAGCHRARPEKVPGETDLRMREVKIEGEAGRTLALDPGPLVSKLGLRKGGAIYTHRYYNPFRQAEDRRRVAS